MPKVNELNALSFGHAIPDPLSFGKHHTLAASAIGAAAALLGGQASAATIVVNSTADNLTAGDSLCTLREALANANADSDTTGGDCIAGAGADIISLAGLSGSITLGGTHLRATGDTQFQGPGAGTLTISGNDASRIFYVRGAGLNVTISALTLTGGRNSNGAAIRFEQSGSLTIDNATITGNTSTSKGGALFFRNNSGSLSITHSTVSGNTASSGGAGLFLYNLGGAVTIGQSTISGNSGGSRGSGLFLYKVNAPLTITESTISGNSNSNGRGGGIFLYKSSAPGSVTIQRSTISGNTAGQGGGIFFYKTNSAIQLENSTISGNAATAGKGGGIYLKGSFGGSHSLDIRSSTIASNTASGSGGNIDGGNSANTIQLTNSIVAGGAAPSGPDILNGVATVTANFTLIQSTSGATIGGANNLLDVDPQLAALANNGGSTQTRLIASSSPALNAGTAAGLPATDQRGFSRNVGPNPDMGAVELSTAPTAFSFTAQTGVNQGSTVVSGGVTIVGLDVGAPISIVGGSYSINGGPFVTTPGTVQTGDVVTVRVHASNVGSTLVSATLTIGGVTGVFNVTSGVRVASVPTLSEWGMVMLSSLLLLFGFKNRRTWFRKDGEKG